MVTALPLVWGEGEVGDIVGGRSQRAAILTAIDAHYDVRPVDVVTDAAIGNGILILAQPRRLAPVELVAIDNFVRRGGQALIFADPDLRWPSRYPLGDVRRAPPVTLLDPLLTHWGLILGDSDNEHRPLPAPDGGARTEAAGKWTVPKTCTLTDDRVADCRIGKGRIIVVADADLLDDRGDVPAAQGSQLWVLGALDSLAGKSAPTANHAVVLPAVAILAIGGVLLLVRRRRNLRT